MHISRYLRAGSCTQTAHNVVSGQNKKFNEKMKSHLDTTIPFPAVRRGVFVCYVCNGRGFIRRAMSTEYVNSSRWYLRIYCSTIIFW